ncbi:MAG: hypothetical protein ACI4JZ_02460 [Oscillospiraceae bacterium]
MKAFGIFMAGILAAGAGVAAAAYLAKKKLEKENEEDYFDGWDDGLDEDWDLDFDENDEIDATAEETPAKSIKSVIPEEKSDVFTEEADDTASDEEL